METSQTQQSISETHGPAVAGVERCEKSIIAIVHPVVIIARNAFGKKNYKQESITLLQDATATWTKILPRSQLKDRFVILERMFNNASRKYMVANPAKIKL
jgi:hypothetical protein